MNIKGGFYSYKGSIKALPPWLAIILILIVLILIPVIIGLVVVAGVTTLLIKSVASIFLPERKKKIEFAEYEIVEEKEERKRIEKL